MNDLVKNQQKKLLNGHGKGRSHRKFSQFGNMYFGHYELKEVQNPSNSYIHQKNKKVVTYMHGGFPGHWALLHSKCLYYV